MRSCRTLLAVIALLLVPSLAAARGGGGGHGGGLGGGHHSSSNPHSGSHNDGHPSGGVHSRGPSDVHSHSDSSPRGISPKSSAPSAGHESKSKTETKPKSQVTSTKPPATNCENCPRDVHGKILRSEIAKRDFMKQSGYPHGRPGYVVDHIVPLAKGGKDTPSNMQWQTSAEARAKDKVERR